MIRTGMTREGKAALRVFGVLTGATVLGVAGKLAGVIDVSWLVATSPLWAPFAAAFVVRFVTQVAYQKWWEIEKRKAGWE